MNLKKLISGLILSTALTIGVGVSLVSQKKDFDDYNVVEAATPSSYSKIYRFTAPAEYWGETVYVHAWGASSGNTTWPGINISSEYSYNESDRKVYTFCTNVSDYKYLIFHNNSGWQTNNITIGSNTAWYLDSGNAPGTWTSTNQTYYLYDYKNLFNGSAKVYAWQSKGSLYNTAYPGVAMTKVQYGSGQLYSISLDPAFDMVKFGIGDSANTGDQWCNKNRGNCFCWWDAGNGSWSSDLDWVKAHDWIYQTMHMRDIQQSNTSDTGACRGSSGYYQKAKTAYQNYPATVKEKMSQDALWGAAQARFSAWATANGETANFSGTNLTVKTAHFPILGIENNAPTTIAVLALSLIALLAITGYFFIKKKRAN